MMPYFKILNVSFTPDQPTVSLAVQRVGGIFDGQVKDLYTEQDKLTARAGGATWSDEDLFAIVEEKLTAMGETFKRPAQIKADEEEDAAGSGGERS